MGQSNMAGRGKLAAEDKTPHPRVLVFTLKNHWEPAVEPITAEPEPEALAEPAVIEEAAAPVAVVEEAQPPVVEELIPEELLPELTITKPGVETEAPKEKPRKKSLSELEWPIPVETEEVDEDELDKDKKKKKKKKGQQLLFDEESGQVISKKHRKPSRQRGRWDEFLDE